MSLKSDVQVFVSRMDGLTAFLDEGAAPNAKQFAKVLAWVGELRTTLQNSPIEADAGAPAAAPDEPVGGVVTTAFWKKQVKAALEEQGYDPESADEILPTIAVDLNADPQAVAAKVVQGM